jgi:hypothetical protein
MEQPHRPIARSGGEASPKSEASWARRTADDLGNVVWSPMTWILLGLFALAEFSNWRMGVELAQVCELARAELRLSPTNLAKLEIDNICRNRTAQDLYRSR